MNREPRPLNIELLGSLSASLCQTPVTPSARKQRQVLALLALNAGRVVTVPALAGELWADRPPHGCATTPQTYHHHPPSRGPVTCAPGPAVARPGFRKHELVGARLWRMNPGRAQDGAGWQRQPGRSGKHESPVRDKGGFADLLIYPEISPSQWRHAAM